MRFRNHERPAAVRGEPEPVEQLARGGVRVAAARAPGGERRAGDVLERGQAVEEPNILEGANDPGAGDRASGSVVMRSRLRPEP